MSTPIGGRKRTGTGASSRTYTAEGEALTHIAKEAEARLAARRSARAEAREIRMKELERQQKEAEKKMDEEFAQISDEKFVGVKNIAKQPTAIINARSMMTSSQSSLSSGTSQRDNEENIQEITSDDLKDALYELEDKYKKAMMTNAQLDNQKAALIYQVDTLKDVLEEQEECMQELQREAREKHRDLELCKREKMKLTYDVSVCKEMLKQRDDLIEEYGLVLVGGETTEEDVDVLDGEDPVLSPAALVTPDGAQLLEKLGDGSIDFKLKKLVEEKEEILEQIKKLKAELEEEKSKNNQGDRLRNTPLSPMNGPDLELLELQRETGKQVNEYKMRLQKTEQDKSTLEGNIIRLESQVKRYKIAAENAEKTEDELKAEKRKLQRELKKVQERIMELELDNSRLSKRVESLKSRSARNQALL
ncbi:leucine-rich repeat flightless-interacting protein 2-like isoform X3 [Saccoglossus kowalevskii]|uniref:Leucine-rich repeat flightless-interacting protein 2-like isoform X2 n=1 Tax=Saccoglossus kowalevskii TaxID=10224 RepID=A0ABM0MX76_SACKO|nr:PREDICTED: leucine-rich repeat flightless-interacting protein 2-like isoform X2 [Saccoglossus kowalevskii]